MFVLIKSSISSKFGKKYKWPQEDELLIFHCQVSETNWSLRSESLKAKEKKYNLQSFYLMPAFPQNSLSSTSLENLCLLLSYGFAHIPLEIFKVLAKM